MKAVGFFKNEFVDLEIPKPSPSARDLLVRVRAVSVNPVDVKQRHAATKNPQSEASIFGWDAAGIVEQVGSEVTLFHPGEEVFYSGSIIRPGCDSEYHLVDERIAGHKPRTLSFEESAALPLTSITAWESLFDRCGMHPDEADRNQNKSVLIIGGAGGVGSVAIQIAKQVAKTMVIATASRAETIEWCRQLGADMILNHRNPLADELLANSLDGVDYILCCNSIEQYVSQMPKIIRPQGKICSIIRAKDEGPLPIGPLMQKSVGFEWELMFTRSMFQTSDMQAQHDLLERVSQLADEGVLRSTLRENFGPLNASNLTKAHARVESGEMIGKLVLTL